jgi:hypothetical protein
MYDLSLDRSTVIEWSVMFVGAATLCLLSLGGLASAIWQRRSRVLTLAMLVAFVLTAAALSYTRFTPQWFYHGEIEPSVALGEAVYRRYEDYRTQHGHYPQQLAEITFPELAHFNEVPQLGRSSAACDGAGGECRYLGVELPGAAGVDRLQVVVADGLFRCEITNMQRQWACRDMR